MGSTENIVGKGENVGYQHFLLLQQCFYKASFSGHQKSGLCGKGLTLSRNPHVLMCLQYKSLQNKKVTKKLKFVLGSAENIVGKG